MKKLLLAALSGWFCLCWVSADDDYDLRINGDFRGAAANAAFAPGWNVSPGEGSTRVIPGKEHDEFAAEITAGARDGKAIFSDFHPVRGNSVKLEAEIKGSGTARIGIAAFDANKKQLFIRDRSFAATTLWNKIQTIFPIPESEVKFVQVELAAEPGSVVAFADVDAEFKRFYIQVPAPGQTHTSTQQQPQTDPATAAPQPQQTVPAAPTAQPAPPAPVALPALIPEKRYTLGEIGSTVYQTTVPLAGEIDFELEEETSQGRVWSIASYDPAICRVEMEHDRDGILGIQREQAEIELKGISRGTTTVRFTYPDGKSFQVNFTVR